MVKNKKSEGQNNNINKKGRCCRCCHKYHTLKLNARRC